MELYKPFISPTCTATLGTTTLSTIAEIGIDYYYDVDHVFVTHGPPQGGRLTISYYASSDATATTQGLLKPSYYSSITLTLKETGTVASGTAASYSVTVSGCQQLSGHATLVQHGGSSWALLVKLQFSFRSWTTGGTVSTSNSSKWYF